LATSHDSPIGGERDGRDTEDLGADEITRADTQWAVPREYQVELGPASAEATDHDHNRRTILWTDGDQHHTYARADSTAPHSLASFLSMSHRHREARHQSRCCRN